MNYSTETKLVQELYPKLEETVLKDYYSPFLRREMKDEYSTLTETDLKMDKLITQNIKSVFPKDQVLSEEASFTKIDWTKRVWVLDPICGTSNFASGVMSFTTNIVLVENKRPVLALVVDYPNRTYLFASQDKPGVYVKNAKTNNRLLLDTKTLISVDYGYLPQKGTAQEINQVANIVANLIRDKYWVITLSTSLSFSYAAIARYAAFLVTYTYPWDNIAACYLMEKNGGIVTDFSGNPWQLDSKYLVGSLDKKTHQYLLNTIKSHWGK